MAEETCSRFELISPAYYEDRQIEVTYDAHDQLFVVPATYEMIDRKFVATEAHCPGDELVVRSITLILEEPSPYLRIIPVKFKQIDDASGTRLFSVEVPSSVQYVTIPPHPPQVTVRVRKNRGTIQCSKEKLILPEIKRYQIRVVVSPASVRAERVPPKTITIMERVIVKPAHVTIRRKFCTDE